MKNFTVQKVFVFALAIVFLTIKSSADDTLEWAPARVLGLQYPQSARLARIDGIVEARCIILKDGSVEDVIILSGSPILGQSVKANLILLCHKSVDLGLRL